MDTDFIWIKTDDFSTIYYKFVKIPPFYERLVLNTLVTRNVVTHYNSICYILNSYVPFKYIRNLNF